MSDHEREISILSRKNDFMDTNLSIPALKFARHLSMKQLRDNFMTGVQTFHEQKKRDDFLMELKNSKSINSHNYSVLSRANKVGALRNVASQISTFKPNKESKSYIKRGYSSISSKYQKYKDMEPGLSKDKKHFRQSIEEPRYNYLSACYNLLKGKESKKLSSCQKELNHKKNL